MPSVETALTIYKLIWTGNPTFLFDPCHALGFKSQCNGMPWAYVCLMWCNSCNCRHVSFLLYYNLFYVRWIWWLLISANASSGKQRCFTFSYLVMVIVFLMILDIEARLQVLPASSSTIVLLSCNFTQKWRYNGIVRVSPVKEYKQCNGIIMMLI